MHFCTVHSLFKTLLNRIIMKHLTIDSELFTNNRNKLITNLLPNSIVMLFSPDEYPKNGDQQYKFRQNSNLYHLCGIAQEETILILASIKNQKRFDPMLFVKQIDEKQRIWHGEKHSIEEAKAISGIKDIKWHSEFDKFLNNISDAVENIYYLETPNIISFDNTKSSNCRRLDFIKNKYPNKKYISINSLIQEQRLIKQEIELEFLKKAVAITKDSYYRVLKSLKPNMMEYEIEAEITYEFLKQGANGHAYDPIVASGKNACILHYIENNKICKNGDLLLMDFGADYGYYAADCSRTIPVNGKFTSIQAKYYNAVFDVFEKAKKLYTPGNTINKINAKVEKWMEDEMIKLGLFTTEDVKKQDLENPLFKKYFPHGTAHFIGLDVHDVGTKDTVFKKGMVLSCEPGLYIEDKEIGIRIETDMLVEDEPIDLMADYPVRVEEIEEIMIKD